MADSGTKSKVVERAARRLRFPKLFLLMALLFGVDLFIPDAIPFVDEVMLGLMTAGLAAWRTRRELPPPPPPQEPEGAAGD